ncbi:MAG: hypothetical protein CMJ38_00370 [Phycisphaerae bacterium]|nr:hypothetical protein [Phycisphaerae bacterium]
MRIFIDIGHPAHVHYFKNFIKIMEKRNHQFLILARNKDVTHKLLDYYDINYVDKGKGSNNLFGKFIYGIYSILKIFRLAIKFKPHLFFSFASPYAAQASTILNKPHITFTDTEHAFTNKGLILFSKIVCTPKSFKRDYGDKHRRFNGFFELGYLHPKYFSADSSVLKKVGIREEEKFIIIRFVSWHAGHDFGYKGLDLRVKVQIIEELSKHVKVYISSEDELPKELIKYQIKLAPYLIHDFMAFASYFLGESGTMTTESAILGVPSIQVSALPSGTIGSLEELEHKYGLVKIYENFDKKILQDIIRYLNKRDAKKEYLKRRNQMLNETIDITNHMIDLVDEIMDNYEN